MRPLGVGQPANRWHVDFHGTVVSSGAGSYKFIFIAVDAFTKYAMAMPISDKESETIVKVSRVASRCYVTNITVSIKTVASQSTFIMFSP